MLPGMSNKISKDFSITFGNDLRKLNFTRIKLTIITYFQKQVQKTEQIKNASNNKN